MSIFRKLGWFFVRKETLFNWDFLLFAVALVQLVPPKVIGIIIDEIADKNLSIKIISWWILLLILAAFLQYLSRYIWRTNIWKCSSVGERTSAAAIQTFYRNGQSLLPKISDWRFDGSCNE